MKAAFVNRRRAILAACAFAAVSTAAIAADIKIDAVAGVYKSSFKNGNIDGGKYQSEDILEIVKVSPTAAYVRTHLEFFNGHVCNIWGVANVEGDALLYRGSNNIEGKPCALSVKTKGGKIMLDDKDGACAIGTCGNRGMYNGTAFDLNKRRAIRYMEVLQKSDQYLDAIDEHDGKPKTRMP
jgi:hypothetical protein